MPDVNEGASFEGDPPMVAEAGVLADRRELALVAVERTRMPMVVTDPRQPHNPIVLANRAFLQLCGYSAKEVVGQNCRFLQGPETDPAAIETIRRHLAGARDDLSVELLNYRKDGTAFWNQLVISPIFDDAGELIYYFSSQKDITARRRAEQLEATERLLLREVDHRAMNALALVQSFVTLGKADSVEGYARSIRGRVDTLARAHRLLGEAGWKGADLCHLFNSETPDEFSGRVTARGAAVLLPTPIVQPLALVIHELMSNAVRHGALCQPEGLVRVDWQSQPQSLQVKWRESGPRCPAEPAGTGVGMKMVDGLVKQQLGGHLSTSWTRDGLHIDLDLPLAVA